MEVCGKFALDSMQMTLPGTVQKGARVRLGLMRAVPREWDSE